MISVANEPVNIQEEFELEKDILFFKVGLNVGGLVSFHGKNYNIKKRLTSEQLKSLIVNSGFYQVRTDCFVNISKIKAVEKTNIYFGEIFSEDKHIPISRWKLPRLKNLLHQVN